MSATLAQQLRLATYKNALIKKRKRKESVWEMLRELRSAPAPLADCSRAAPDAFSSAAEPIYYVGVLCMMQAAIPPVSVPPVPSFEPVRAPSR